MKHLCAFLSTATLAATLSTAAFADSAIVEHEREAQTTEASFSYKTACGKDARLRSGYSTVIKPVSEVISLPNKDGGPLHVIRFGAFGEQEKITSVELLNPFKLKAPPRHVYVEACSILNAPEPVLMAQPRFFFTKSDAALTSASDLTELASAYLYRPSLLELALRTRAPHEFFEAMLVLVHNELHDQHSQDREQIYYQVPPLLYTIPRTGRAIIKAAIDDCLQSTNLSLTETQQQLTWPWDEHPVSECLEYYFQPILEFFALFQEDITMLEYRPSLRGQY